MALLVYGCHSPRPFQKVLRNLKNRAPHSSREHPLFRPKLQFALPGHRGSANGRGQRPKQHSLSPRASKQRHPTAWELHRIADTSDLQSKMFDDRVVKALLARGHRNGIAHIILCSMATPHSPQNLAILREEEKRGFLPSSVERWLY